MVDEPFTSKRWKPDECVDTTSFPFVSSFAELNQPPIFLVVVVERCGDEGLKRGFLCRTASGNLTLVRTWIGAGRKGEVLVRPEVLVDCLEVTLDHTFNLSAGIMTSGIDYAAPLCLLSPIPVRFSSAPARAAGGSYWSALTVVACIRLLLDLRQRRGGR